MLLELALEPLRAGADAGELGRAAGGTRVAGRLARTAVVAAEASVLMERERDVAVETAPGRAAGAAVERGRDAASVEEQDRLPAPLRQPAELGEERPRERIRRLAPQVDDADRRHRGAEPSAELEVFERLPRLRPRRCGAEDGDRSVESGPLGGDRARVVARVGVLLVRGVLLLVHADHAECGERCEDGGAGADDDGRVAREDSLAFVAALGLGETGVEQRNGVLEARAEAADGLWRQGDLGHEDDRAAPGCGSGLARADVDLRLPAARRAGEEDVSASCREQFGDARERGLLRFGELGWRGPGGKLGGRARITTLAAAGRIVGSDKGEGSGGRRAVVVGEPEGEVDERGRQRLEDAPDRGGLDSLGSLDTDLDHHAAPARVGEADLDDCALLHRVGNLVGEGPREGAGVDERVDGGEAVHP